MQQPTDNRQPYKSHPWLPHGLQEWIQVGILLGFLCAVIVPAIAHYWLGIQRLGGFASCLRDFLGM